MVALRLPGLVGPDTEAVGAVLDHLQVVGRVAVPNGHLRRAADLAEAGAITRMAADDLLKHAPALIGLEVVEEARCGQLCRRGQVRAPDQQGRGKQGEN